MTAAHWLHTWLANERTDHSEAVRYLYRLTDLPTRRVLDAAMVALTDKPMAWHCVRRKPTTTITLRAARHGPSASRELHRVWLDATVPQREALDRTFELLCGRPLTRAFALGDF